MRLFLSALIAASTLTSCAAVAQNASDVILMRRVIVNSKTTSALPTLPLTDPGDAYGWLSTCGGGVQTDQCVGMNKEGDLSFDHPSSTCSTEQNTLYKARVLATAIAFGVAPGVSPDMSLAPAGIKPDLRCGDRVGYVYRCVDLKADCYGIDVYGQTARVDASKCSKANLNPVFNVLGAQLGMQSPPVNASCSDAGRIYGVTQTCGWRQDGNLVRWGFSGQCHAVDPAKGLDSILSEEACLSKVGTSYSQADLATLQAVSMKPVTAGYNSKGSAGETCAGTATGETGALTRAVSSDTVTQLPACRRRRTIVERWSCIDPASADLMGNGTPIADSACSGQNAQWYAMMTNPMHDMSGWTVSIDRGSPADVQNHLRTTVYEYPSSCG